MKQVATCMAQVWVLIIVCGYQMWFRVENDHETNKTTTTTTYIQYISDRNCAEHLKLSYRLIPTILSERDFCYSHLILEN